MEHRLINILLAEDNLDDIEITKKAFKEARLINRLCVVRDGEEIIDFLYHKGEYKDISKSPRPGLIILDINMPKLNGTEVLKKIKEDESLKHIPVIMLTVSRRHEDIVRSYNYGCNSFLQKPVDFDDFVILLKKIGLYWCVYNIPFPY